MSPSTICPVAGSSPICPAEKRKPPATVACEYGPMAAGALSVFTCCTLSSLGNGIHGNVTRFRTFPASWVDFRLLKKNRDHELWGLQSNRIVRIPRINQESRVGYPIRSGLSDSMVVPKAHGSFFFC